MDARRSGGVQEENGDTVIRSQPQHALIFGIVLSVPVARQHPHPGGNRTWKNRLGCYGFDEEDRDGFFGGRRLRPTGSDRPGHPATGNPSSCWRRAVQGQTKDYRCQELRRGLVCRAGRAIWGICSAWRPSSNLPLNCA